MWETGGENVSLPSKPRSTCWEPTVAPEVVHSAVAPQIEIMRPPARDLG
jgi:hypothetical protein